MNSELPKYSLPKFFGSYTVDLVKRLGGRTVTYEEIDMTDKIAIVTGANSGIGKAVATVLAKKGAEVILACRNLTLGQEALSDIEKSTGSKKLVLKELDLENSESIKKFASEITKDYPRIHLLVNNAGIMMNDGKIHRSEDNGYELHMAINHLGTFTLTNLLLDNLKNGAPSRVVTVSSSIQLVAELDLNDLMLKREHVNFGFQNVTPYANSKLANSLFSKELGKKLEGTGVTTYSLCPGIVKTSLFRHESSFRRGLYSIAALTPAQGAETILFCSLAKSLENETGKIYRFCKHFTAAEERLDSKTAETLWTESEKLVNLNSK